jgi:hypothetical protein
MAIDIGRRFEAGAQGPTSSILTTSQDVRLSWQKPMLDLIVISGPSPTPDSANASLSSHFTDHIFRVGLNWHLN